MKKLMGACFAIVLTIGLASCGYVNNETEPNNSRGKATSTDAIIFGGEMGDSNDVDWFVLQGQEGTRANFEISHAPENDFDFEVYSGGTEVGSAIGLESGDNITVGIPGTCYVKVWQSTGTGAYHISVSPE